MIGPWPWGLPGGPPTIETNGGHSHILRLPQHAEGWDGLLNKKGGLGSAGAIWALNANNGHKVRKGLALTDPSPHFSCHLDVHTELPSWMGAEGSIGNLKKWAFIQKRPSSLKHIAQVSGSGSVYVYCQQWRADQSRRWKKEVIVLLCTSSEYKYICNSTTTPFTFFYSLQDFMFPQDQGIQKWLREFCPRLRKVLGKYLDQRRIELITGMFISPIFFWCCL